jgi:hypothetical protein
MTSIKFLTSLLKSPSVTTLLNKNGALLIRPNQVVPNVFTWTMCPLDFVSLGQCVCSPGLGKISQGRIVQGTENTRDAYTRGIRSGTPRSGTKCTMWVGLFTFLSKRTGGQTLD